MIIPDQPFNDDLGIIYHIAHDSYFLPIPKNASTPLANDLHATETRVDPLTFGSKELLIVIRDPIERWASGLAQHWVSKIVQQRVLSCGKGYFGEYWREAVEYATVDPHTYLQSSFIDGFDTSRASWVWLDSSLDDTVGQWASDRGLVYTPNSNDHRATDEPAKSWVLEKIRAKIQNSPGAMRRIQNFYRPDYELISSVDFLNR